MSDLNQLFNDYQTADQSIDNLEKQLEAAKKSRSTIAKQIRDDHGAGPHTLGGKQLMAVSARGGAHFLRAPLARKKTETVDKAA